MYLRGLWHPLVGGVPNNVRLGVPADRTADGAGESAARTLLLTGPNMGGKSTLLRATCLAVIMAHVRAHFDVFTLPMLSLPRRRHGSCESSVWPVVPPSPYMISRYKIDLMDHDCGRWVATWPRPVRG